MTLLKRQKKKREKKADLFGSYMSRALLICTIRVTKKKRVRLE